MIDEAPQSADELARLYEGIIGRMKGYYYRCRNDADYTMTFLVGAVHEITGYTPEELLYSRRVKDHSLIHPDDIERIDDTTAACIARLENWNLDYRLVRADGTVHWVNEQGGPVHGGNGEVRLLEGMISDIDDRKRGEAFRTRLLESLIDGVFGIDREGRFTFLNPAAVRLFGIDSEAEYLGRRSHELTHHTHPDGKPYPASECPIYPVMRSNTPLHAWEDLFWRRDGSSFPVEVYAAPLSENGGGTDGAVVSFRDISRRKALEAQLEYYAHYDRLTRVTNRAHMEELLDHEAHRCDRYGEPLSVIMFDLDHFKQINDTSGHQAGDEVLRRTARAADKRLRTSDVLGRWGGEEFLALLPNTRADGAVELAETLRQSIAATAMPDGAGVTISLGVAERQRGESVHALLKRVDDALYRAKNEGRNRVALAG